VIVRQARDLATDRRTDGQASASLSVSDKAAAAAAVSAGEAPRDRFQGAEP